jgi:hypothetical protein
MQAPSTPSRTTTHLSQPAWVTLIGASLFALFRMLRREPASATHQLRDGGAMLWDAHSSMRCGNPTRSVRVLSNWLKARGNQPEDYGRLAEQITDWEDRRVISWLTEAHITRLLTLKRSAEALPIVAERLRADPRFRPRSSEDTLSLAQLAARSGAQRISRILLSDFSSRFPGDPRVSVSEALKRRLAQETPARMRA